MQKPSPFEYTDFRKYLQDAFEYEKQKEPKLSLRNWCTMIHDSLSDGSQMSAILKKRRNLSSNLFLKLVHYLKLKGREREYLELLVQFNQSKKTEERQEVFKKMLKFKSSKLHAMSGAEIQFFSQWYFPVIWSYIGLHPQQCEPSQIVHSLGQGLSKKQVIHSLKVMLELKLIQKTANGYSLTQKHLKTPEDFADLTLMEYSQGFLDQAKRSLETVPPELRQSNTMVLTCSKEGFHKLKEAMQKFQDELRTIVEEDHSEEHIYALGMQLFPCTQLKREAIS